MGKRLRSPVSSGEPTRLGPSVYPKGGVVGAECRDAGLTVDVIQQSNIMTDMILGMG